MSLKSNDKYPCKLQKRRRHRGQVQVKTDAEIEAMSPPAKEAEKCVEPSEPRRGKKDSCLKSPVGVWPC